jgi:hypothetical protein
MSRSLLVADQLDSPGPSLTTAGIELPGPPAGLERSSPARVRL